MMKSKTDKEQIWSREFLAELAKRINSSPAWVRRALIGCREAHRVRRRLAASLGRHPAKRLGLEFEWLVEQKRREMREDMASVAMTGMEGKDGAYQTRGIGGFIVRKGEG